MRSVLIFMTLVAGCATIVAGTPATYDVLDDPERGGFGMSFTNRTSKAVCLPVEDWPNGFGWLDHPQDRVFVRVGSQTFSAKPHNAGYCPGCSKRVEAGQTVTDFLPYERFELPPHLRSELKRLEFKRTPMAYPCEGRTWFETE